MGTRYFSQIFREPREATIAEVLHMAGTFPRFVEEEEEETVNKPVMLGEIEVLQKWFRKTKA